MRRNLLIAIGVLAMAGSGELSAAEFKNPKDCVVGSKVQTRQDKAGTITGVAGTMCQVQLADGTKTSTLFWMLRPAGSSSGTGDKLVPGTYPCYSSAGSTLNYMFMDIVIEGPDSYRDKQGKKGKYRLEKSNGKITFESGPLARANAKLMDGPRIGLNMDGGSFFNASCSLKR